MPDAVACENTITEAAVTVAAEQVGVHEVGGNNRGPQVELYLASVNLPPGSAWCAASMFWCFRTGAARLGVVNPFPRTGSALHVWSLADKHFRVTTPRRGCVYVVDHGGGLGHTGIIESVADDGLVTELSGNTNAAGSREGNAFARHADWRWQDGKAHGGVVLGFLDFALPMPLVA
jgi:hypothetical protein